MATTVASAYDIIDDTSGDGMCITCHAAMNIVNPALSGDLATQTATLFFQLNAISRPDLEAESFLKALQGLILTPDYFCANVVKVCAEPRYEPLSLESAIDSIMEKKPADADHYIDKLYA